MPVITRNTFLPSSLNNQLPAYLSYFASGMLMVKYWEEILKRINIFIIPSAIAFILCTVCDIPFISCFIKPITLCIIILWLGLRLKPFYNVGRQIDYSYAMYLVHYPLIMCFISVHFFEQNWGLAFLGVLGTTFLFSYILEKMMED